MRMRTLGKTGLKVSELSLGGLFVASFATDMDNARAAVRRALDIGVNYIDTAPTYDNSEEVLGQVLEGEERPFVLSTKLGGRPEPFHPKDRDALLFSVEESLRLLKRDTIDILYIHEPDRPGQYDWWENWEEFRGPVLDVLDELKRSGTIRFTGLGGTTAYEMAHIIRTGRFDVLLTAYNYSLLWREAEREVIPAAREMGMGIVVGSPLQQGALARRFDKEIREAKWLSPQRKAQFEALYELSDETGMPLPEMGLRFVLSNPDVSTVLMGVRTAKEVEENAAAVEKGPLPAEVMKRLDGIAAMVPYRPAFEPSGIGWALAGGYKGPGMM